MNLEYLFFPELIRSDSYSKKGDGRNYHYQRYYDEIERDCKKRCVYCDTLRDELGGDPLQLDHFKPIKRFPELKNVPENLVLSCSVCNRIKSSKWFENESTGTPHVGNIGFIEPFEEKRADFFSVDINNGYINAEKPPAKFLIELLSLNRKSKIFIRRRRILLEYVDKLKELFDKEHEKILDLHENGNNVSENIRRLKELNDLQHKILTFIGRSSL